MGEISQTKLFILLDEQSPIVSKQEMQHAYENFIAEITSLHNSDKDYQLIYQVLNLTRMEFQSLQTQI